MNSGDAGSGVAAEGSMTPQPRPRLLAPFRISCQATFNSRKKCQRGELSIGTARGFVLQSVRGPLSRKKHGKPSTKTPGRHRPSGRRLLVLKNPSVRSAARKAMPSTATLQKMSSRPRWDRNRKCRRPTGGLVLEAAASRSGLREPCLEEALTAAGRSALLVLRDPSQHLRSSEPRRPLARQRRAWGARALLPLPT